MTTVDDEEAINEETIGEILEDFHYVTLPILIGLLNDENFEAFCELAGPAVLAINDLKGQLNSGTHVYSISASNHVLIFLEDQIKIHC